MANVIQATITATKKPKISLEGGIISSVNPLISASITRAMQSGAGIRIKKTEEWNAETSYIPPFTQIVVYSDYSRETLDDGTVIDVPNIKIGDGTTYIVDLPFIDAIDRTARGLLTEHINDRVVHTNDIERMAWNSGMNVNAVGEELVFNLVID